MFIDEEKIRKKSSVGCTRLPSARFKKGESPVKKLVEAAKLAMGIAIIGAMIFALCALIYTLVTTAPHAAVSYAQKAEKPKPAPIEINLRPSSK